ncbi:unnamed protein product, partial [Timema podura]|nr:unnamed protein product [Timema podura]
MTELTKTTVLSASLRPLKEFTFESPLRQALASKQSACHYIVLVNLILVPRKKLFTPGPLGCSRTVKEAMLTDVGSRDTDFIKTIRAIRSKLIDIAAVAQIRQQLRDYAAPSMYVYSKLHIIRWAHHSGCSKLPPRLGLNSTREPHLSTTLLAAGTSSHLIVCNLLYKHTESNTVCLSLGISHDEYTSVLLQGSGTFSVEAVLQLSSPRNGARVLLLVNGAYGNRMKVICDTSGIPAEVLEFPEDNIVDPDT